MPGSEQKGSTTSTVSASPNEGYLPYLERGLSRAENLYGQGPKQYFPGSTYAGLNDVQKSALTGMSARADAYSPLEDAGKTWTQRTAEGNFLWQQPSNNFTNEAMRASPTATSRSLLSGTAAGQYLNNNPYLDATFDRMAGKVSSAVNGNFSAAGRYGSGAHQAALTENLGGLADQVYGNNYARERQNQLAAQGQIGQMELQDQTSRMQAAQLADQNFQGERERMLRAAMIAPSMAQGDYADYAQKLAAGGALQQDAQNAINADMARFNFGQASPYDQLSSYISAIQGLPMGQTQTQNTPNYSNPTANVVGAGLGLAQIGNTLFGSGGMMPSVGSSLAKGISSWF